MNAFYSGTDKDDLHINTDNYNYYLTIIVNFACKPVAWVTWIQEEEIEYVIKKKEKRIRNGSGGCSRRCGRRARNSSARALGEARLR